MLQGRNTSEIVLQCPPTPTEGRVTLWDPRDAKLDEMQLQVQELRELLHEKQKELQNERDTKKAGDGEDRCEREGCLSPGYFDLAEEAGALLAEVAPSVADSYFKRRVERWHDKFRLRMKNCQTSRDEDDKEQDTSEDGWHLRQGITQVKESLAIAEEMVLQTEKELKLVQLKLEKVELELEEQREQNQIKTEQLVNQQIVIDRLRGVKSTVLGTRESSAGVSSERRAHSVPLSQQSCALRPLRKIHSSPPVFSLERVMASFKMRGLLLLDALDRKQEVYCPFVEQRSRESSPFKEEEDEEEEEEEEKEKMGFRRSLNRTWTSRHKNLTELKKESNKATNRLQDQQTNPRPHSRVKSSLRRKIHDLSIVIKMKEELIREMDKPHSLILTWSFCLSMADKLSQAVDRQGSRSLDVSEGRKVLAKISLQNQLVRAQTYNSLQHMLQQRAALQACSAHEAPEIQPNQSAIGDWLVQVEEQVLQIRAEQKELEQEQRRRAEVQERREACLQQRNRLQDKKLRSSQEEHSLLELEEALETLDAALEFKTHCIQRKQSSTYSLTHREDAHLRSVQRRLRELSPPEITQLLIRYFNKVVSLRESEQALLWRCEELELQTSEQDLALKTMEGKMQRLVLDTDRRLMQQHRDNQSHIQLLLRQLRELRFSSFVSAGLLYSDSPEPQKLFAQTTFALFLRIKTRANRDHLSTDTEVLIIMASSAMITVPTTASRFALLQVDSDSDSDCSDAGKTTGNDKKKDKKKKRKEQQQSEANELRNLAFKKFPRTGDNNPGCTEGWQQWKQRDEQMTSELYQADLEKALLISKLEYEQQKENNINSPSPKAGAGKEGGGKKEKKKNQQTKDKKTVSLQDFQAEGTTEHLKKKQEQESRTANNIVGPRPEERFFNKLEDDVSRIIQQERRREQFTSNQEQEVGASTEPEPVRPRAEQLKYELEKKDQEIQKLKKTISQWEVKYKEVKARNSQLLKMLQQGEMKDKAEILVQVEELLHIKEELSSQVSLLHAALEQERSKVKGLQSDQPKHQSILHSHSQWFLFAASSSSAPRFPPHIFGRNNNHSPSVRRHETSSVLRGLHVDFGVSPLHIRGGEGQQEPAQQQLQTGGQRGVPDPEQRLREENIKGLYKFFSKTTERFVHGVDSFLDTLWKIWSDLLDVMGIDSSNLTHYFSPTSLSSSPARRSSWWPRCWWLTGSSPCSWAGSSTCSTLCSDASSGWRAWPCSPCPACTSCRSSRATRRKPCCPCASSWPCIHDRAGGGVLAQGRGQGSLEEKIDHLDTQIRL
ncbi:hypothetical protein WMY93_004711 [Mugilogobius chulae]|uniref:Uncharacterized protein n=1 Tax=Mugilogobius chulae TaxID=88201 RepID=A0AAW0Q4B2_9GOBI